MPILTAAVLDAYTSPFAVGPVRYRDAGPTELFVRTLAAPFCATDAMAWRGMRPKRLPAVLGHTAVGLVEAVGADVAGLRPGRRVLVGGSPQCDACFFCGIGRPDQCEWLFERPDPIVGTVDDGLQLTAAGRVGAYAEAMLVDRNQVWVLDTDLDDTTLSLLGCGITTGLGAVLNVARVEPGQSVAIVGLGHIGQWAVQAARIADAGRIIAVDVSAQRRAAALAHGATHEVDPVAADPVEQVRELTDGRGADVVVEAAGPARATRQAVLMTRRAGTTVLTGVSDAAAEVSVPQTSLAIHGRSIVSCQNGQTVYARDVPRWIGMLEDGRLDASRIISATYSLHDIDLAREASDDLRDLSGVLVL